MYNYLQNTLQLIKKGRIFPAFYIVFNNYYFTNNVSFGETSMTLSSEETFPKYTRAE